MIPFFYFLDNWFLGDKNNINLNNLFQKLFCSPWKVPISTRIILRNTIKRSRMLNQLLLTQNVQISIVFLSVKSIIMKIKEWHHVSLTSNISGKTWSNCTCKGCFEIVITSRFQNWPWFWKLPNFCGSNRGKQHTTNLFPPLYKVIRYAWDIKLSTKFRHLKFSAPQWLSNITSWFITQML